MSTIFQKDREILKPLLEKAKETAFSSDNEKKFMRWRNVNEHIKPDSPPIYMMFDDPAWEELMPEQSLLCESREARQLERKLKQNLFLCSVGDDTPVNKKLNCPAVFDVHPRNKWGVEVKTISPEEKGGAWKIDSPLKTPEDFDKLVVPEFTYNHKKTEDRYERIAELSQGIFEVERVAQPPMGAILSRFAGELRGLSELMLDMAVNPELVHRLMEYLMMSHFSAMKAVESANLISPKFRPPWYECDDFGPEPIDGKYSYKNCWVRIHGQDFDQISPGMWDEFLLPYLSQISEKYGKAEFGCCESLTNRINKVLQVPNLALVICSVFSNMDKIVEAVGDKHVIQWRQHPTHFFFERDMSTIKHSLEEGFKKLKGCHFQIAVREIITFNGNSDRLTKFTDMVREMADN